MSFFDSLHPSRGGRGQRLVTVPPASGGPCRERRAIHAGSAFTKIRQGRVEGLRVLQHDEMSSPDQGRARPRGCDPGGTSDRAGGVILSSAPQRISAGIRIPATASVMSSLLHANKSP